MNDSRKYRLKKLAEIKCFLLDMDGTFYLGNHLLPGAKEFINLVFQKNIPFLFLSNNSSKNEVSYQKKLHQLGFDIGIDQILTSGEAAAQFLKKKYPQARAFLLGTPPLKKTFVKHGFLLEEENPEVIVLGFDTTFTYKKLWRFCDLVRKGLPYIATHPDINCPTETGFMPDIGSTIEFIAASTGRRPDLIIGKPNRPITLAIEERTHVPLISTAMVGDRLYTDIAMGSLGLITILVLSGETKKKDLENSTIKPDLIYSDLAGLYKDLKEIHH